MIDDGLHSPNANIATMLFALTILRPSGFFIVEDIRSSSIPIWQVVAAILPESYRPIMVQARGGLLFMIQKPDLNSTIMAWPPAWDAHSRTGEHGFEPQVSGPLR